MVTARERDDIAVLEAVAQMVALEESKKPSTWLRPPRVATSEELAERRRHLAATEQLSARLGKIDIPADELVRLGRERGDHA